MLISYKQGRFALIRSFEQLVNHLDSFTMSSNQTTSDIYAFPPPSLQALVNQIAALLTSRKQTISVAETAAGGIISASLLSVPGASAYYKGGLTLYTLASRIAYGGWSEEMLKTYK